MAGCVVLMHDVNVHQNTQEADVKADLFALCIVIMVVYVHRSLVKIRASVLKDSLELNVNMGLHQTGRPAIY